MESKLGFLETATGACMGTRRFLWIELGTTDDCDFTNPVDVVLQGYRVVFAKDAIADDTSLCSLDEEVRARIRMTSRNLVGIARKWKIKNWIKLPLIRWWLLSHRMLRWVTLFILVVAYVSNLMVIETATFYQDMLFCQTTFYGLPVVAWIGGLRWCECVSRVGCF